jgi:hypothetical protein
LHNVIAHEGISVSRPVFKGKLRLGKRGGETNGILGNCPYNKLTRGFTLA